MAGCLAVIRVRVPDRPGALGLVASRIGALKGDIVGIEVLDRRDGVALDELVIVLPDEALIPAVTREIAEVDGAVTESVTVVDALPEPRLDAIRTAIVLSRAPDPTTLASALVEEMHKLLQPTWCAIVSEAVFVVAGDDPPESRDALALREASAYAVGTDTVFYLARDNTLSSTERRLLDAYCEFADVLQRR